MQQNGKKWLPLHNAKWRNCRAKLTINEQTCGKLEQKSHWASIS